MIATFQIPRVPATPAAANETPVPHSVVAASSPWHAQRSKLAEKLYAAGAAGDVEGARAAFSQFEQAAAESDEVRVAAYSASVADVKRLLDEGKAAEAAEKLSALLASTAGDQLIKPHGASDIFAKLGAIDWLCEGLEMAPGAPSLWAGYGFSGKTLAAQQLALCVAAGRDFGNMRVKRGKVLHLDYEQGSRLTYARYQRLSHGMGIWSRDVDANLSVAPLPSLYLSSPKAETILSKACEGHALCIVDSFRASCPDIDENSSEARKPLDVMNRVSERTGCTFLVVHHAKKPQGDGRQQDGGGQRMSIRGSSGFYDACCSAIVFHGVKGQPTRLYHEKARITGRTREDMLMSVADVEGGGLALELSGAPESVARGSVYESLAGPILEFVKANPECSLSALRAKLGKKKTHVEDTLRVLLEEGRLVDLSLGRSGEAKRLVIPRAPEPEAAL
jgi:hypothetical protein